MRSIAGVARFCLAALLLADIGQVGKAAGKTDYGFKRVINPEWFPDDPRQ